MPTLGCEGSLLAPGGDKVLFSGPDNMDILRIDLTVWESEDRGATYKNAFEVDVDSANVGYSSMAQLHDGSVAILWGRALTASTFFVPDFVSFRMLPAELSGPAVDASPWATGSGEAHSMDWQEGYSFTQFKGTGGWWAICTWGGKRARGREGLRERAGAKERASSASLKMCYAY
jgi:hypothetical protein